METTAWSEQIKEDTAWTEQAKTATSWQGNTNATTTTLVDDLSCLVDDPLIFIDGYNPLLASPLENINKTVWS